MTDHPSKLQNIQLTGESSNGTLHHREICGFVTLLEHRLAGTVQNIRSVLMHNYRLFARLNLPLEEG